MKLLSFKSYFISFIFLLFVSCGKQIFYWGDYSNTLYQMKKKNDPEHREKHKKELVSIIATSNKKKLKVPPGIYCEYGYLKYQDGDKDSAIIYIDMEEKTFPESSTFTKRLKKSIIGN